MNMPNYRAYRQRGMALVVALILLLVMTMVAVVAMRSTTLDLKMTTNTALTRRAFQNAEAVRMLIGPLLEAQSAEAGWPEYLGGGIDDAVFNVQALENFTADEYGLQDTSVEAMPSSGELNLCPFADKESDYYKDCPNPERENNPDFEFFADADDDGVIDPEDVRADVWITKIGYYSSSTPDTSGSGLGDYDFYQIRATGYAPGNAQVTTTADFRVRVYKTP